MGYGGGQIRQYGKFGSTFKEVLSDRCFQSLNESESCLPLDQSQYLLELTDVDGEGSVKHLPRKFRQKEGWNCDTDRVRSKGFCRHEQHNRLLLPRS